MGKNQFIDPKDRLKTETIKIKDIEAMSYKGTLKTELESKKLSQEDAIEIYKEMMQIRVFETFILEIKTAGKYNNIPYVYGGPAHISIGQEAAAVGQHFLLTKDDFVFGTHRNHAEVISKAHSAIYRMNDKELKKIMEDAFNGEILNAAKNYPKFDKLTIKEQARIFLYVYIYFRNF